MARPCSIEARNKQLKAVQLRKQGCAYEQIACEVGYAQRADAQRAVNEGLRTTLVEPAEELRALELERLDAMWEAIWPQSITAVWSPWTGLCGSWSAALPCSAWTRRSASRCR